MSHTEGKFLGKIAEQSSKGSERGEKRGGRYFGGKQQELGSISGEIEPTEVLRFAQANSIADIINVLENLPDGALKTSANKIVDRATAIEAVKGVEQFMIIGGVVPGELLRSITGEQGFRAAVIREIIKYRENFFTSANNLDEIIKNLENIMSQNITLEPLKSGLIMLKDSSGNLIDMQKYIDNLKYIKEWIAYNFKKPVPDNFYTLFTSNHGIRAAIMRATGK